MKRLLELETVRFDQCAKLLREILEAQESGIEEYPCGCGVIYSDIPFPKSVKMHDNLFVTYQGKAIVHNIQVHLLALNRPKSLPRGRDFLIPSLSEAVASILSFSIRRRFISSRLLGGLDRDGKIQKPYDIFVQMASSLAGPRVIQPVQMNEITKQMKVCANLLQILRRIHNKDFRRITRSFRLYQLALLTYPMDIGLAYSLLVSSVDTLSCKLSGSRGKKTKFVHFISQYLPESFWSSFDSRAWEEDRWLDSITPWNRSIIDHYRERYERSGEEALFSLEGTLNPKVIEKIKIAFHKNERIPDEEKQAYDHILQHWYLYRLDMKITQKELSDVLELIYKEVRSAFYHGGRSPPQSAIDRYEVARIKPNLKADGTFIWERDIPSFYTFERIARDSILSYLFTEFS